MNIEKVEKIADAVLYEGYMLYPYRASAVKNRQRFNFGVLYPREYGEAWEMRTECLVEGPVSATVEVKVRFLQMVEVEDRQEGREREMNIPPCDLSPGNRCYPLHDCRGSVASVVPQLELQASQADEDLFRVRLTIRNLADMVSASRDQVLLRSMISVHSILHCAGGEFVSLLDPPERFQKAAAECQHAGAWPVLAGDEGQKDLMLCSPIILYDYPQIAPESPGDLCDGLEIDEILALRILTMTDAEKEEVRNGDDRARRILERTEMLPPEHFQKLHGALRGLR